MARSPYQDNKRRLTLRRLGHNYIDDLVEAGMDRGVVYRKLAKALGVPEAEAHFSTTFSIKKLHKMVGALGKMHTAYFKNRHSPARRVKVRKLGVLPTPMQVVKPPSKYKRDVLPRDIAAPLIRQVAEANNRRRTVWWRRWIAAARAKLHV